MGLLNMSEMSEVNAIRDRVERLEINLLECDRSIKEIVKKQGLIEAGSSQLVAMVDDLTQLLRAGDEPDQERLSSLEKLRRTLLKPLLRQERRIAEIELHTQASSQKRVLTDIYYLIGATKNPDPKITGRIIRCLERFASFDDEIIRRAAFDALNEIRQP